jgi:hypothetical protein
MLVGKSFAQTFCPKGTSLGAGYTDVVVKCASSSQCKRTATAAGASPSSFDYECASSCTAVVAAAGATEIVCTTPSTLPLTYCYTSSTSQLASYSDQLTKCASTNKCKRTASANGVPTSTTTYDYTCAATCTAVAGAAGAAEIVCSNPFVAAAGLNKASFGVSVLSVLVGLATFRL